VNAKEIEIAAYMAAHRILEMNTAAEFACPGAQRSRTVDTIADIIREVFEIYSLRPAEPVDRMARRNESGPHVITPRRSAVLLELPVRASS